MGWFPDQHLVQHAGHGVLIGPPVDRTAAGGLLGAHVLWRADRQPGLGETLSARGAHGQGNPEVCDDRLALQEDVRRLDVPVHDVTLMRVLERIAHGDSNRDGLLDGQLFFPLETLCQRLAFDEWHHVIRERIRRAGIEERKYVGMLEVGRDLDLLEEPLRPEHGGQLRPEHFHGHFPPMFEVLGEVHRRHPPTADQALDGVPVRQRGGQACELLRLFLEQLLHEKGIG